MYEDPRALLTRILPGVSYSSRRSQGSIAAAATGPIQASAFTDPSPGHWNLGPNLSTARPGGLGCFSTLLVAVASAAVTIDVRS